MNDEYLAQTAWVVGSCHVTVLLHDKTDRRRLSLRIRRLRRSSLVSLARLQSPGTFDRTLDATSGSDVVCLLPDSRRVCHVRPRLTKLTGAVVGPADPR